MMKLQHRKSILIILIVFIPDLLLCQVKEGLIHYTSYMVCDWQEYFKDEPEMQQYASTFPDTIKNFYNLFFTEKKSLFQQLDTIIERNVILDNYGVESFNDVYTDLEKKIQVESENIMGQDLLIVDSLEKLQLTITILPEKEEIAGYSCIKALLKMGAETNEVWFTPQIPIPIGPWRIQGLPGIVLKIKMFEEGVVYTIIADTIEFKEVSNKIAEFDEGLEITREELYRIIEDR